MKHKKKYYLILVLLIVGIVYLGFFKQKEEFFLLDYKDSKYSNDEPIDTLLVNGFN